MPMSESTGRRSEKQNREHRVLLGLIDYYLKTGKPVGSATLQEAGFEDLSTATIRNYFAQLEKEGFLSQPHTSGGRVPTHEAYRTYAKEYNDSTEVPLEYEAVLKELRLAETREIASYLQQAAEKLSELTQTAVFLSAPRFDHDYIVECKLMPLDHYRCLCVILTDFGMVKTEVLQVDTKLSAFACKRIESYFHWRLTGSDQPEPFEEEALAQKIYNELILRYVVNYSNFIDPELYRTGFSRLLNYPDFRDVSALSTTLSLFEDTHHLRRLIKECCRVGQLKWWIGDQLTSSVAPEPNCAMIASPYFIHQTIGGAVGLLGPTRIPYRELFGIMRAFSSSISEALTRNLYKFQITFRQPHSGTHMLGSKDYQLMMDQPPVMMLESKERQGK